MDDSSWFLLFLWNWRICSNARLNSLLSMQSRALFWAWFASSARTRRWSRLLFGTGLVVIGSFSSASRSFPKAFDNDKSSEPFAFGATLRTPIHYRTVCVAFGKSDPDIQRCSNDSSDFVSVFGTFEKCRTNIRSNGITSATRRSTNDCASNNSNAFHRDAGSSAVDKKANRCR